MKRVFFCTWLLCAGLSRTMAQTTGNVAAGMVQDEKGQPIEGAAVFLQSGATGFQQTTLTNSKGIFTFNKVPSGAGYQFIIRFIGYRNDTLAGYEMKDNGRISLSVSMHSKISELDNVVVVGYGTQKKINLSGAVESVSAKEIANRPINNLGQALQGLIPNLNISLSDGRANTAPSFNVRGLGSLNGGEPFILVDHVPVTPDELSRINPADVESVSVLKDAASAAIYGARAAYGVVLIVTKKAKTDQLQVTADANVAIRTLGQVPSVVTDPLTVMQYKNEAATPWYNLYTQPYLDYAAKLKADPTLPDVIVDPNNANAWSYFGQTDWLHAVYNKTAPAYTANVSIAQRSNKLSYMVSGGYYRQDGMMKYGNDIYKRYTLRVNSEYHVTDWLTIGLNSNYANNNYDSPTYMDGNLFWNVNRQPSLMTIYNPDGTYTSSGVNIIGGLSQGGRRVSNINDLTNTLFAEVRLNKDWVVKADANFRSTGNTIASENLPVAYRNGPKQQLLYLSPDATSNSSAKNEQEQTRYNVVNVYTDYHKTLGKHYFQALLGYNQEYHKYNDFWVQRGNLITNSLPTPQLATGAITQYNSVVDWAVQGVFFRANYIFNDKYILEINGREDGSSRFPTKDQWGFSPSASAAWVVSHEKFMTPVNEALHMDVLKLRGSYGRLGNQNFFSSVTDPNDPSNIYPAIPVMSSGQIGQILDGTRPIAVYQPGTVAPSLTWEKVSTVNFGADLAFLHNRLNASYDIYNRATTGMLMKSQTMPAVYGASEPRTNAADMKTKGWELSLSWRDQFRAGNAPFHYAVRLSLADNQASITRYSNPTGILTDHYNGEKLGSIWGFQTAGFFKTDAEAAALDQTAVASYARPFVAGDLKFVDLNGDKKIDYGDNTLASHGDRRIIGNSYARLPYSVDLSGDWKGFDIRFYLQGVGKRDWYPGGSNIYFWGVYAQPWTNITTKNIDHWTPEHPDAYFPRLKSYIAEGTDELGAPQTKYLQNAAYLRLKNFTVGYTLPASLLNRWKVTKARFYLSGENLLTVSHLDAKLDPEGLDGNVYPFQKTFSAGFNLTF